MIETPRLTLVPWPAEALDLESLGRALDVVVPKGWRPEVTDVLPAAPPPYGPYAILAGERLVGTGGFLGPPDDSGTVEIGYEVAPDDRGQGYATEAAMALVSWALEQPAVRRVIAVPDPGNNASRRVLERAGLREVGTRGNGLLYELRDE